MSNIYQAKGETIEDQYRDLGTLFGESIRASVDKLGRKRSRLAMIRKSVAEKSLEHIERQPLCRDFLRCIKAWCQGASINQKQAMWLLADNLSGCQTMMVRYGSGVALMHTEEEFRESAHMELHMTDPQTVAIKDGDQVLKTLVYNNLLPGCGLYSWKVDMLIAMDSLFLREDVIGDEEKPLLANMISWMIWRMNPGQADARPIVELVNSLGTLIDGYAINVVRKVGDKVEGYKLTLARSEHYVEYLEDKPGSYIKQVNIIDPSYPKMQWVLPPKRIWRGGWKYFTGRLKTLDEHAKTYRSVAIQSIESNMLEHVHTQFQRAIFGKLSDYYVNADMGAMCIGLVDNKLGTSVSCKLNDDKDIDGIEYLDLA